MKKIFVFKYKKYLNQHSVSDFSRREREFNDLYGKDTEYALAESLTEAKYILGGENEKKKV